MGEARVAFAGDAREVLAGFPADVRTELGCAIWKVQNGEKPDCATWPMPSIGKGVFELKEGDGKT